LAFRVLFILTLFLIIPNLGRSELRDPTKPDALAFTETTPVNQSDKLALSAIWISPKTRRATINGISVQQGQTILNGVKIIKIKHNMVIVQQNGVIKTLQLLKRPYKNRVTNNRRQLQ
jgi:hypothetical protein